MIRAAPKNREAEFTELKPGFNRAKEIRKAARVRVEFIRAPVAAGSKSSERPDPVSVAFSMWGGSRDGVPKEMVARTTYQRGSRHYTCPEPGCVEDPPISTEQIDINEHFRVVHVARAPLMLICPYCCTCGAYSTRNLKSHIRWCAAYAIEEARVARRARLGELAGPDSDEE